MSDSEEVESEDEFDLQLEFLDLFDPKRARKIHPIACANCTLSLEYVKYIECQECRATICLPCFQLGCEMGDHERNHAYRIVDGLQNKKLKGHWNDKEMTELILAAQKHKLGNWNEYLEDPRNSHHSRASICSFFDKFMIRGIIGQFALTEGFWMKDRHKYKRQGTLQKLLDEETHSNPLLYSMYLAAMRWKKGIHWKPNDPKLEEKIRVVCKDYINYKFDIEGRELLGSLHDDYFFGGDLNLPKPIILNPEFEEAEAAQTQMLRDTDKEAIGFYEQEQERKKRQIQIIKQQTHNGEVIALDMTAFLPKIIIQREGEDSKEEEDRSPDEPGPSRITPKRATRSTAPVPEASPLQQIPESSNSLAQQSPLKIVLKKGEKGNYIVALNTLNSEINKEGTMANMIKSQLQKKAQELGSLSRLRVEGIPDQGTSSETNGYHSPEHNGTNGANGTDSDDNIEDNELLTDDNSDVDLDENRLEQDTQLDEADIDQLAAHQLLEDSERPRRGRPKKKVTYVEEEEEEPPATRRTRIRRPPKKHDDEEEEPRSSRVKLRSRRNIKPLVQDDDDEDEPPVEARRKGHRKNKHIDEDEEEVQPEEPKTRRSSRLFIKIPDAEEQEEQVEEEPEEEVEEERARTSKNVINQKKQRRKKKVNVQKSKKLRRIEAFHKRETKKAKKKEKANLKYTDIISLDQIRALREKCSRLQLYCDEERRRCPPKFRPDDIAMLTFNPHRNEYECESINDAERLVGNLQIGPHTAIHEMTDLEHEIKFARIERYNRALHIRNARKNAINEHEKIFEFIDYIKYMVSDTNNTDATYDRRTPLEKIFHRTQQTLTRDEYNLLVQRWRKFTDMKHKIQKLQELQRQGVTSLKGVDLKPPKDNRIRRTVEIPKKADSRYRTFQKNHLRMYHLADE